MSTSDSTGKVDNIEVFLSPTFSKALKKLSVQDQSKVEDEIDNIIDQPELGQQKKGDLSYLRVHKFMLNRQQTLLGYSWQAARLTIYLLNLGSHENFYQKSKSRRESDRKLMGEP